MSAEALALDTFDKALDRYQKAITNEALPLEERQDLARLGLIAVLVMLVVGLVVALRSG